MLHGIIATVCNLFLLNFGWLSNKHMSAWFFGEVPLPDILKDESNTEK